jgi:hypothetical protein
MSLFLVFFGSCARRKPEHLWKNLWIAGAQSGGMVSRGGFPAGRPMTGS